MGLRDDVARVLIPQEQLQARVAELGQAIDDTYGDDDRPLLVCVVVWLAVAAAVINASR